MNNSKNDYIKLSPFTLNLFLECKRCFWLQINKGIHRPASPFSSLPGGMDEVIKKYFDKYRLLNTLPPEIKGKVVGNLMTELELLNQWRSWYTGLKYIDSTRKGILIGALDDCLVDGKYYIPVDYKTRGYPPSQNSSEEYYQNQLNCYAFLLEQNGYPVRNFAYLIYYYPKQVKENGIVEFNVEPIKIRTYPEQAKKVFEQALDLLRGDLPEKHSKCSYCSWAGDVSGFE